MTTFELQDWSEYRSKSDVQGTVNSWMKAEVNAVELHPLTGEGACGCWKGLDCLAAGKHPVLKKVDRPDYRQNEGLFEQHVAADKFVCGYGVDLPSANLLVVDVDERNGGVKSYSRLAEALPEIAGVGLIVETGSGSGSRHLYFFCPHGVSLRSKLPEYPGIDFKTTGFTVGPGSMHKSGKRYSVAYGTPDEIDEAPAALIELLSVPQAETFKDNMPVGVGDIKQVIEMLGCVDPDIAYGDWLNIGNALKSEFGDQGFSVWDNWSSKGKKYDTDRMSPKWDSLESGCVSLGRS